MKPALWLSAVALCGAVAYGQTAISARSGMVHYVEGRVLIGDHAIDAKFGAFPEVKENQTMRTEEGRAEVLLTPGAFLRLGENSSFRMVTNRLIDTRLEFLSGAAIVEVDDLPKDNAITMVYKEIAVKILKKGLYKFNSEPAQLRVYDGEAAVAAGEHTIEVKEGRMITLDGDLATAKFDKDTGDSLDRWSRRRGEYVAIANISAAKSYRDSGYDLMSSIWAWNPYFGMFTYIPYRGLAYSPYGYRFYSPITVGRVYYRPPVYAGGGYGGGYNSGLGYGTMAHTSSGYSGTVAASPSSGSYSAPSTAASAAASAPVSHGGGGASAGHAGGGGGGRK